MDRKSYLRGLVCGASAFTLWGLLPLYWKWVHALPAYQVFAHRIVWSLVFLVIFMMQRKTFRKFVALVKTPRQWLKVLPIAVIISVNWLVYIWSVNNGYVIESSLGYFINPLMVTLLGSIFLGERLDNYQKIGILLATIGVLMKTVMYGKVPWIALAIALSFALYGLLKKKSELSSLMGLGFETFIVGIPAFVYLVMMETGHQGISGQLPGYYWLMIALSGIVTAVPLLLYAEGAKNLPLKVVGFLQYIAPTLQLLLGIFVFDEAFEPMELIPFSIIWAGLIFFTYSQLKVLKKTGMPQCLQLK